MELSGRDPEEPVGGSGDSSITGEMGGKLGCDVDRLLIMAASAVFCHCELNLEAEGSLLPSCASPLLCIVLQSAERLT